MAASFSSASSQYLTTASTPVSSAPFTISVIGSIASAAVAVRSLCVIESGNSNILYQLFVDGGQRLAFYAEGASGNGTCLITTPLISTGFYFHACAVVNSASNRVLYLNGTTTSTSTTNIGATAVNRINIGSRYYGGSLGGYQNGQIAEVGIWNAALTAAEIASLASGMTPDKIRPQNLVFYAPLVRDLIDQKGGLTITNNNGATVAAHPRIYP